MPKPRNPLQPRGTCPWCAGSLYRNPNGYLSCEDCYYTEDPADYDDLIDRRREFDAFIRNLERSNYS